MSGPAVAERLYVPGASAIHLLPAPAKLAAAGLFLVVVIATPPGTWWAFAWYAALLAAVVRLARLPSVLVLRRMTVEGPFLVFAALLPFVGRDPTVDVLGVPLSQPGLSAAGVIAAKATLGVGVSVLLAATTRPADLLAGLARLRVPEVIIEIASFMVRYLQVVADEWHRMAQARAARGFQARGPRSWLTLARSVGVLFVRSYERGERVHQAMLSRGYSGELHVDGGPVTARQWGGAAVLPLVAAAGLAVAVVLA